MKYGKIDKIWILLGLGLGLMIVITAFVLIGSQDTPVSVKTEPEPVETSAPTPEPEPTEDPLKGKALNPLTGLYIEEAVATRRPVAVVINNYKKALPQSGLGQADIYYEILAEGGITRIIAVFQDFDSEKIGPVRSARHYFLDFALNHDAIFVHHGGSQEAGVANAYNAIKNLSVDNLDGMRLEGTVFWRDPARYAISGMKEHSSYTSAAKIWEGAEKAGYRVEKKEDALSPYGFYDESASPKGAEPAVRITVPYAYSQQSVFEYDDKQGVYKRFQNGEPHIDEETGEQLEVSNVLIQYASVYTIQGDAAGRQDAVLTGGGDGYLCTNGVAVPITWKKENHQSPTLWFDAEGAPLLLNRGKTWICVHQNGGRLDLEQAEPSEQEASNAD